MRIALMTNNYKPFLGGVPISVERLARGLEERGHEVTVFAPTYKEQQEEENCFRYGTLLNHFIGGIVIPNPLDRRIEEEFATNHYDIIHVHHPMLIGRTAVYLSRKYKIPLTFTYHTRYEQYLSYAKPIRMLEKAALKKAYHSKCFERDILHVIQVKFMPAYLNTFLRHCDYVFAPTDGMRKYLEDVCGLDGASIDTLSTGIEKANYCVEESTIKDLRCKYQAENIPFFLTVSRMSHEKNVHFLLEAVAKMKAETHKSFRMLVVGDGPNKEDYEEDCKELGIDQEVTFTGQIDNDQIAPYFAAADAFLFASKTETQGIVIAEAFAGKTPVIALDASGVSDLVQDNVNGYLCEENVEEFAEKMAFFMEHEECHERMSGEAYATAFMYREEEVAKKAERLYNNCIARHHWEQLMADGTGCSSTIS